MSAPSGTYHTLPSDAVVGFRSLPRLKMPVWTMVCDASDSSYRYEMPSPSASFTVGLRTQFRGDGEVVGGTCCGDGDGGGEEREGKESEERGETIGRHGWRRKLKGVSRTGNWENERGNEGKGILGDEGKQVSQVSQPSLTSPTRTCPGTGNSSKQQVVKMLPLRGLEKPVAVLCNAV